MEGSPRHPVGAGPARREDAGRPTATVHRDAKPESSAMAASPVARASARALTREFSRRSPRPRPGGHVKVALMRATQPAPKAFPCGGQDELSSLTLWALEVAKTQATAHLDAPMRGASSMSFCARASSALPSVARSRSSPSSSRLKGACARRCPAPRCEAAVAVARRSCRSAPARPRRSRSSVGVPSMTRRSRRSNR